MSKGRESKWTQEELARATRTAQEIWMHDPSPAFIEFVAQRNSLLDALMEVLPEGWADDDTMEHMPGVKTARRALASQQENKESGETKIPNEAKLQAMAVCDTSAALEQEQAALPERPKMFAAYVAENDGSAGECLEVVLKSEMDAYLKKLGLVNGREGDGE